MGTATNGAVCGDCQTNKCQKCKDYDGYGRFEVVLEWLSKEEALKVIKETKCPCCGSDNWKFTDTMGQ